MTTLRCSSRASRRAWAQAVQNCSSGVAVLPARSELVPLMKIVPISRTSARASRISTIVKARRSPVADIVIGLVLPVGADGPKVVAVLVVDAGVPVLVRLFPGVEGDGVSLDV